MSQKQKDALTKWLFFSVLFSLVVYPLAVFNSGFDASLVGDGSLIIIAIGLVAAAGASAFDEGIATLKKHWLWFGIIALVLLLGAGAYAATRSDLLEAAKVEDPLTFEDALRHNEEASSGRRGEMSSSQRFAILRERLAQLLEDLTAATVGTDRESSVARQQDVVDELLGEVRAADEDLRRGRQKRLADAEQAAWITGIVFLLGGLALGGTVVYRVNG